jgi:hypothetical protein
MELLGRVQNGVIVLEGGPSLPEGALVTVLYTSVPAQERPAMRRSVQLPLVRSDKPGSRSLTADRLAEILDEDDVSA